MTRLFERIDSPPPRPTPASPGMMTRKRAEEGRPIGDVPKEGNPPVHVGNTDGKAQGWTKHYGLIEWLDASGNCPVGWAHSSNIKRALRI